MSFITSIEHGIAVGWHDMKVAAQYTEKTVLPALKTVQGTEGIQELVAAASGIPQVQQGVRVEESLLAWAVTFIETAEKAGNDPASVLGSLVTDVKTLTPMLKAAAIAPQK